MLEARNISFAYTRGTPLLTNWSHAFDAGEMVAITGRSGRGKSTLLYLMGLMLRPSSGAVFIDGVNVTEKNDRERAHLRARKFGFVFQDAALDPTRSILDNVLETSLYRGANRRTEADRAQRLLVDFGVAARARARPGQVSGGQAQRIALCRALLNVPDVVLADEPTGNLDPESSDVVLSALHDQARAGSVVIVVTHDPATISRCDRQLAI